MTFNLLDDNWIPALYSDGRYAKVGIRAVLTDAALIRQIAASNPMDNVAVLRFLLAATLWSMEEAKSTLSTLRGKNVGIPEDWLAKLSDHKAAFNLLGDDARFYQDGSLKKKEARPVADLLVEFPGADSVNHLRHVVHGSYGFCPACCVLGILRLSVWASANRYYPASVNPGTAAYAITKEKNLLLTLVANLPEFITRGDQAPWLSNAPPDSRSTVACLAWRPRKLWLNVAPEKGSCANCGGFGMLVASLCNERGWATPTTDGRTKKFWDADPHLLRDAEPISLPGLGANAAAHTSRFWRTGLRVRGVQCAKIVATGPVVNKFIFQDATSVDLPGGSAQVRAQLSSDCNRKMRSLMTQVTSNPDRQHPEISSALVLLTPNTEARIRAGLSEPDATQDDAEFLREIYEPVVEQVVGSTARGSALRRLEAIGQAKRELYIIARKLSPRK